MPRVVAILDDDGAALAALAGLVEVLGYATRGFCDPADFLASSAPRDVSCLIADMRLPGFSGLMLHERLRMQGIFLPTILVTAYPDDTTRRHALGRGVDAYLGKPVSPDELLACLRRAVG